MKFKIENYDPTFLYYVTLIIIFTPVLLILCLIALLFDNDDIDNNSIYNMKKFDIDTPGPIEMFS